MKEIPINTFTTKKKKGKKNYPYYYYCAAAMEICDSHFKCQSPPITDIEHQGPQQMGHFHTLPCRQQRATHHHETYIF